MSTDAELSRVARERETDPRSSAALDSQALPPLRVELERPIAIGLAPWWAQMAKAVVALVTALAAIGGVFIGVSTLRHGNELQEQQTRLQQAQLDSHLGEVMMSLDRHFVANPDL